jgi:hypothetical protein
MNEKLVLAGLSAVLLWLLLYSYLTSLEKFITILAMGVGYLALGLYTMFIHSLARSHLQEQQHLQEEGRLSEKCLSTSSPRNCTSPN